MLAATAPGTVARRGAILAGMRRAGTPAAARSALAVAGLRGESALGRWRAPALAAALDRAARRSTRPVVGDGPAVVSLTTYGARFAQVHRTIESIARGS